MAEDEKIARLSHLLDVAERQVVPRLERDKTRLEPITPTELYCLCYECTNLLNSLCRIDKKLITEPADQQLWRLKRLSGLKFSRLDDWSPGSDDFNSANETPASFWGKVLDTIEPRRRDYYTNKWLSKTYYQNFCRSIFKYTFIDDGMRLAVEDKWAEKKRKKSERFILDSNGIVNEIMKTIYGELIRCPVDEYPAIRCKILRYKLAEFRKEFVWDTTVTGPYILNFGGLWEGDFREGQEPLAGQLSLKFVDATKGVKCKFYPDKKLECFEWGRLIGFDLEYFNQYEHERNLFMTWEYGSGLYFLNPQIAGEPYWVVGDEPRFIELYTERMEKLATPLLKLRQYKKLIDRFLKLIRNEQGEWKPCYVQWSYIKELDKLIKEVDIICKQQQNNLLETKEHKSERYSTEPISQEQFQRISHIKIPPERRSAPLSLNRMAQYWGGDMTAKKLRSMIDSKSLKAYRMNRQTFIFDTEYLPAEVIARVKR